MRKVAVALIALAILFLVIAPAFAAKFVGVTVHWTIPTTNTDGTPCTDLAGFRLFWGANPSALTNSVTIQSASATSYTVTSLAPGTWYFVVTAFTTGGTMSAPSNVVEWSPPAALGQPVHLP